MSDLTLVIGNKASSSWSLRPWLALKRIGAPFLEITIPLRQPDTKAEILGYSPAGKVPVLIDGDLTVYDSLAILEYLAESFPEAGLWPDDRAARAIARSISAEMHSGFADLRKNMSMDVTDKHPGEGRTPETLNDIARITQVWRDARARFGADGPFLFGRFGVADAMYAPVCTRFDTYGVELDDVGQAYVTTILGLPEMREWYAAGAAEPWGALR
ncbi:glutathione S-transferase [Skermanella stibiiresistens SB22]|uniref:Glutathione S-transferase n=1 Tax=Skermanella stibiiresistens SB22 TaxID=1385369 RepID=W9H346_9PROT|nr:glutathione S-transferase family protein [Skermanella stibiiresistens]EWY39216.1 glutathione S-transferase [Skermanella stibiiresistens SB22]